MQQVMILHLSKTDSSGKGGSSEKNSFNKNFTGLQTQHIAILYL